MSESRIVSVRLSGDDLEFFERMPGEKDSEKLRALLQRQRAAGEKAEPEKEASGGGSDAVARSLAAMLVSHEQVLTQRLESAVRETLSSENDAIKGALGKLTDALGVLQSGHETTHDLVRRGLKQVNELSTKRDQEIVEAVKAVRK